SAALLHFCNLVCPWPLDISAVTESVTESVKGEEGVGTPDFSVDALTALISLEKCSIFSPLRSTWSTAVFSAKSLSEQGRKRINGKIAESGPPSPRSVGDRYLAHASSKSALR